MPPGRSSGLLLCCSRGDEEAALSFLGATGRAEDLDGPWLVADIGGGSTELAVGPAPGLTGATGPSGAISLDLGCVRVTERFFRERPSDDRGTGHRPPMAGGEAQYRRDGSTGVSIG